MATGRCTDADLFLRHDTGPGHPERPARLTAILDAVADLSWTDVPPRDATRDELLAVHDAAYLDALERRIADGARALDADTVVSADSWRAAVRAAGAALALGEAWFAGTIANGFAFVRPPGHHACRNRAMGFCLLGNVAILARFLHAKARRVAIVDWDVHHGNGTQDALERDDGVGFVSLHQMPLWPGTGRASECGIGNVVNVPMAPGSGDAEYLAAFDETVVPFVESRAPDVVIVSAGFDAHLADPLAQCRVTTEGFGAMADRLASRWPVLAVLEGGYDLAALAASVRVVSGTLIEKGS